MDADRLEENGLVDLEELTPEELAAMEALTAEHERWQEEVRVWEARLDLAEGELAEKLSGLLVDVQGRTDLPNLPPDQGRRLFYANVVYRLADIMTLVSILCGAGRIPITALEDGPGPGDGGTADGDGDGEEDLLAAFLTAPGDDHRPVPVVDEQPRPTRRSRATRIPWSDLVQ